MPVTSQPTLNADALQEVHAFWLAGMSCDGCSIAAVGATSPSAESLMLGNIPGVPKVVLHHPVLSPLAGEEFMEAFQPKAGRAEVMVVLLKPPANAVLRSTVLRMCRLLKDWPDIG